LPNDKLSLSALDEAWRKPYQLSELTDGRHDLYEARLAHVRTSMKRMDMPVFLVSDPNTIFYLTGARNMQLFGLRSPSRFLLCFCEGPVVLFEYVGCEHLARHLPTIDVIRPAVGLNRISSGDRVEENCHRFASSIRQLVADHDPDIDKLGIDRIPFQAVDAFRAAGFTLADVDDVMVPSRAIKLPVEIPYMREAMMRVESAVAHMEAQIEPGMTESEAWAGFHYAFMAKEGQYVSTRLFQSGSNTFPYFQEADRRQLAEGELLCLDTDALGYEGYAVDFSRTFLCGGGRVTGEQRDLYVKARDQLEHNAALLGAGVEYREVAEKAWVIPQEHLDSRYYCIGHGLGMAGEFPNIPHRPASGDYPLEGNIEPGMVICIESYVGSERSEQGVKLEDQFLILDDRVERMSVYPFSAELSCTA